MGTDIHLYFEKKNKDSGKWEEIEVDERLFPDQRYYELFSFLADVRYHADIKSGFEDRGLPSDSIAIEHLNDTYIHSQTYFYLDELKKAPWKEAELDESYFYIFCAYILPKLAYDYGIMSDEDKRNVRVIMGFDN